MKNLMLILLLIVSRTSSCQEKTKLIFSEDFSKPLDTMLWKTEIAPLPKSKVYVNDGQLFLDTQGGVTVWLNKKFSGNIRIEYKRKVLVEGGTNDRLSDLNSFWMASDPRNENLFTRNGVLERYDSLRMYYVGMGGNTNSTTRFRKYQGNGERTLLKEFKDSAHLLKPNKNYMVIIEVIGEKVRYFVDGDMYFEYDDPAVLKKGYFGFRSTKSRQAVDWIRVYQVRD